MWAVGVFLMIPSFLALRHSHFRNEFKSSHCHCIGALAGDSCHAGSGEGAFAGET